jgi:hypothetical protein
MQNLGDAQVICQSVCEEEKYICVMSTFLLGCYCMKEKGGREKKYVEKLSLGPK